MPTTLLVRLRVRRDTYTNLDATNRVYGRGEVVYDETNDKFKVGDGITAWRLLPYTAADAALSTLSDVQLSLPLTNGQTLAWNSTAGKWVNATVGISDGDKGDITVSNSGGTWTIDNGVIGTAKLGGDITPAGKALLDDLDAPAQRNTLGLGTVATQNANAVALTGGTVSGINVITGTYQSPVNEALMKIVRKATSGTINKGEVVYITGSQGTHLTVELADADAELTSSTAIGVAAETITDTVSGYIITQGLLTGLSNLPTGTFSNGAALWLSSTPGGWTTSKPNRPAHLVFLGWVQDASNGAAGRAYIKVINGQELDELHDVLLSGLADGHILQYDTGLWRNRSLATAGVAAASHTHGNITSGGLIGSTANLPIITGTGGILQAGSFGTAASTFCEGNDSRLSNSRTPTGSASGDLSGNYPGPTVAQLQGRAVSSGAPSNGQGLVWSTSNNRWEPTTLGAGTGTVTQVSSGTGLTGGPITTSGTLSVDFAASGVSSATQAVRADDSRLSDARTPLSHTHGNITNGGLIGTTANLPIVTGTGGILQAGTLGSNLSLTGGTLAVTASGTTTQVQFNDGGTTLGGHSGLTYDKSTSALTIAGDLAVNGGDITSTSSSFYIATAATDVRIATAAASAPEIRLGTNITGNTVTLNGIAAGTSNLSVNVSTGIVNLFTGITTGTLNVATGGASTINLGGAAASVNIGTTSGNSTLTIQANSLGTATLATTTGVSTGNLFNTFVANLNIGGAATALALGATTGSAQIRNPTLQLGSTTSQVTTAFGTANSLTLQPYGNLTISPTISTPGLGGTQTELQVTNAVDGTGQVRVTGGNLYLGRLSADGVAFTDVGILFEGATANSFTTRLQAADPGANRTITLPNASGTVALIAGSTNQVFYNSSGAMAASSALTFDGSNLSISSQGDLRLGSSGSQYFAFQAASSMANSNIYTLPAAPGTANQVLQIASVTGNDATLQWATVSGSGSPGGSSGQIQFNNAGAFAGDSGLTYDAATDRMTVGSVAFGANGEFFESLQNGAIDVMPSGTSATEVGLRFDMTAATNAVRIGTRRASDNALNTGRVQWLVPLQTGDNANFILGDASRSGIRHSTDSTRPQTLQIGVSLVDVAGVQDDSNHALVLCNYGHLGNVNRMPTTLYPNPSLLVYSADIAEANDFVRLTHNQTDGLLESGAGNLNLEAAGDIMNKGNRIPKVFSGTSVPSNALGSDGDVYFKY